MQAQKRDATSVGRPKSSWLLSGRDSFWPVCSISKGVRSCSLYKGSIGRVAKKPAIYLAQDGPEPSALVKKVRVVGVGFNGL